MKMRKLKKGFTLVELVVVIAVIAVLAAVSVGAYFGVTESAKNSNAVNYLKQIKDMWMVFSVSEDYNPNLNEQENAEYFAADYIPYQGITVDVNYRMVNYNNSGNTQAQNDEFVRAVLFKVEYEYSSWFIVYESAILETSEIYKNDEDFSKSLVNFNKVSGENENDKFTSDTFYLCTMIDATNENHKVRGYKYVTYIVDSYDSELNLLENERKELTFPSRESLYNEEKRPEYDPNITIESPEYPDAELAYLYKDSTLTNTYDVKEVAEIGNVFTSNAKDSEGNEIKRGYVCGTINVSKINNAKTPSTDNYPVLYGDYSNGTYSYKFFRSIDDLTLDGVLKANEQSNPSYIFVANTTLSQGKTLNIPSNHNFVVDFMPVSLGEEGITVDIHDFDNIYSIIQNRITNGVETAERAEVSGKADSTHVFELYESDQRTANDISQPKMKDNEPISKEKYRFTVSEGATLNFAGTSKLYSESKVVIASAQASMGILDYSMIENNGTINFNENSKIRTLGRVSGNGTINMKGSSEMIDLFKLTSFYGGTISANMFTRGIFPFNDYVYDNNHCLTNIHSGAFYTFISGVNVDNKYSNFVFSYLKPRNDTGNPEQNGLFVYDTEGISSETVVVTLKYIETEELSNGQLITRKVKEMKALNTRFYERNVKFNFGKLADIFNLDINTALYSFPVSNTDIIIDSSAILDIGDNNIYKCGHRYRENYRRYDHWAGGRTFSIEILPSSSFTLQGTLNLSASSLKTHTYNEWVVFEYICGQSDVEMGAKALSAVSDNIERQLNIQQREKTELVFLNFTANDLNDFKDNVVPSNTSNLLNVNTYLIQYFDYMLNNLSYWNTERIILDLDESQNKKINIDQTEGVTDKIGIYAASSLEGFSIKEGKSYNYKYLTEFEFFSSENIGSLLGSRPLGYEQSFTLNYSY